VDSQADDATTVTGGNSPDDQRGQGGPRQLTAAEQALIDQLPADQAVLVDQERPHEPSHYVLDKTVVSVGRHPDSDIYLDDISVSRRHLEFRQKDGHYHARDVGSLNGTYVNHDRVDEVELRQGDEIAVGKFRLVFYAGSSDRRRDA
jgi:pSer/pThr/pTyr-binding forkhead associated (FHA) protein